MKRQGARAASLRGARKAFWASAYILLSAPLAQAEYCFTDGKSYTDDDYLARAVYAESYVSAVRMNMSSPSEALLYVKQHPDCCRILAPDDPLYEVTWLNYLLGSDVRNIIVTLPRSPLDPREARNASFDTWTSFVHVDRCNSVTFNPGVYGPEW